MKFVLCGIYYDFSFYMKFDCVSRNSTLRKKVITTFLVLITMTNQRSVRPVLHNPDSIFYSYILD